MLRHIVCVLALLGSVSAVAAEGKWTEGFGQGNLEYFIDAQGYRLYIGCPTSDGSPDAPSSVSLEELKSGKQLGKFSVSAGGITFDGPFAADSRVGDNNFIAFLDAVRKTDSKVTVNGKAVVFPKSNAAKTVPKFPGKTFKCNLSM